MSRRDHGAVLLSLLALCSEGCESSRILSGYHSWNGVNGKRRAARHTGVDFSAHEGEDVLAVADGIVVSTEVEPYSAGQCVEIKHFATARWTQLYTSYCHLSSTLVSVGRIVVRGERIATAGKTGEKSAGVVHLHFTACTSSCPAGTSDGDDGSTFDPSPLWTGCFRLGRDYAPDVLTRPVRC